jgi:ureidoglycolate dehydrogenase (NAD+)
MRTAVGKAKSTGIACATVSNSGHFGAAGYYANVAAWEDCIGIGMCNVDPGVAVPGSRGAVLGTNPFAYAVPDGKGRTVFLDIATSVVAAGKIYQAQAAGKRTPEGWLVDGNGLPTTDPSGYPKVGALQPMAGHKGYGLALMVEILTGLLSGGAFGHDVVSWVTGRDPVNQSLTFIAVSIEAFMPIEVFTTRMARIAQEIRSAPKAVGAERIYLPGEKEWENREIALREGLRLPPDVIASLDGLAEDYGLDSGEPEWRKGTGTC